VWLDGVELKFLSSRQSYGKETHYFEVLNSDCLDSLQTYHEQDYNLPIFKGEEDLIIFKVNAYNVDDFKKFEKGDQFQCKIKLRPYTFQDKKGFTPYMKEMKIMLDTNLPYSNIE